jgi:para-aminobenzoate synthetase
LRSSEVPVLGVCLGHQGLGHVLKATVTYAPTMMHGRLSPVKHTGEGLFEGIPSLGANRLVLEYDVTDGIVTRHDAKGSFKENGSIFQVLDRELEIRALDSPQDPDHGLIGGFVGYLGYECKADCGATNAHRSDVPDAVQMLADRLIAIDHVRDRTHVFALATGEEPEAQQWLDQAERAVREAIAAPPSELLTTTTTQNPPDEPVIFRPGRGREQYLADIARCQSALGAGESYEVCLTDQIHTDASPDPWQLYRGLRRSNPAPFAAYLKLGEVTIVSSSPERFLSVDRDRRVQARPIKGTAPRSADPVEDEATRVELQEDEKTFAEHLMIVDLLRNDLGRVCEVDTVRVPELMVIEQYATVHQMISNIVGTLEPGRSSIDCVKACFPGGSMTGAPKLRTMEIIDDIEREARGVYSGAIGWLGLDGVVDLSIVIRTIVMRTRPPGGGANTTTIGAGGAIVMQSDPADEFDEILLKARAPMAAIALAVTGSDSPEAWTVQLEPSAALAGTAS